MKKGLLDFTPSERDVPVGSVFTADVNKSRPDTFGATGLDWGMLGNDRFGDCYWASAAHELEAERAPLGVRPAFTENAVLDNYGAYLGIYGAAALEANPSNDVGTDARAGAKFRQKHGIQDARGHQHYIGAYAFQNEPDYGKILDLAYALEGMTLCVNLPESAEERFETGVWDYVKGSQIAGGHAVAIVGATDNELRIVSWGQEVKVTESFVEKYLQTVVVYFSRAMLTSEGLTPAGLDKAALVELVRGATG